MKIIGITGGIGSGKTTICKVWENLGAAIYYADDAAKKLMVDDDELVSHLKEVFGKETYRVDGSLNKAHLIREAFDKGRVDSLNKLVHPAVAKDFNVFVKKAQSDGRNIVVKEAALLLIGGRPDDLDIIVLILADKSSRMARVMERDGVSGSEVENRDSKQPPFDQLTHLADYLITNDGTLKELEAKAEKIYSEITG